MKINDLKFIISRLEVCVFLFLFIVGIILLFMTPNVSEKSIQEDKFNAWQQYKTENDCHLEQINSVNNTNKWLCKVEVINEFYE